MLAFWFVYFSVNILPCSIPFFSVNNHILTEVCSLHTYSWILLVKNGIQLNKIVIFFIIPQKQQIVKLGISKFGFIHHISKRSLIKLRSRFNLKRLSDQPHNISAENIFVHDAFNGRGFLKISRTLHRHADFSNGAILVLYLVDKGLQTLFIAVKNTVSVRVGIQRIGLKIYFITVIKSVIVGVDL